MFRLSFHSNVSKEFYIYRSAPPSMALCDIPRFLGIVAPSSMALCDIPYFLGIVAPPSMALCDIPYFLYIKKPVQSTG